MDEFIEREALITKFKKMELGEHGLVERLFADGVYAVIAAFPAADVAPVVRCKDCAHYDMGICLKIYSDGSTHPAAWQSRKPEDFCSYGERKDGES